MILEEVGKELLILEGVRKAQQDSLNSVDTELEETEKKSGIREQSEIVLRKFSDELMLETVNRIETLVTAGLQDVFGQDHSLHLELDESRGSQIVHMTVRCGDIEGEMVQSFGGGVVQVVQLLLRILSLLKLKLRPILILDESLDHLSGEYVPQATTLISSLCKKFGIDILMVTHKTEFLQRADHVYTGSKEGNELVLTKER